MTAWEREIERTVRENESRIRQLEKHIHYPHSEAALKEAAARAQGMALQNTFCPPKGYAESAPMRSDVETILTMTAFCKRLLDREDLAFAVTLEVRNEARRALGLKEREV